jgi:NTE family protein
MPTRFGLVLTGGGARAAYQVGVLRAISDITQFKKNPFRVISGYSAGAINGTWLAGRTESFDQATEMMWQEWAAITTDKIFNTEMPNVLSIALRWLKDRSMGGMQSRHQINYLLDTAPLHEFIKTRIDFKKLDEHVRSGELHGISVTAANYHTGHSVTFYSGHPEIKNWESLNRISVREELCAEHVMASSAIPIFFPPVKVKNSHYGDGMIRLNAPLSAAVKMGADRLLVIGIRGPSALSNQQPRNGNVSLGEIAGTILNGLFFDSLDADLARMERINRTISVMSPTELLHQRDHLRYVPVLSLKPSEEIGDVPQCELARLPSTLRFLLKGIGLGEHHGLDLLSYLSFEPHYIQSLLRLGFEDTMAKKDQILDFFSVEGNLP